MKQLLAFAIGGIFLMAAATGVAQTTTTTVPPRPGQHFDCSDAPGSGPCATDDTGCVPQTRDDPSGGVVSTLKCGDGLAKTTVSVPGGPAAAALTVRAPTAIVRAPSMELPVALLLPVTWRVLSGARKPIPPRDTGPRP